MVSVFLAGLCENINMLTHIVCWKYKPETEESKRDEHRSRLRALKGLIPDVISLDAGADMLHLDRSFDTGLVATFADKDALERYNVNPNHQTVVAFGREIAESVVSVDFVTD